MLIEEKMCITMKNGSGHFNASCYRYLACNSAVLKVQIECTISGAVRFKGARDNELDANHKRLLKRV